MYVDVCHGCDARCCRKYFVPVLPDDILRISKMSYLLPEDFLHLYSVEECECVCIPSLWIKGKEYYLGLKRKDDACLFLIRKKGTYRCGINDFKPLVCRTFPFLLDGDCVRTSPLCPGVWKESDMGKARELLLNFQRTCEELRRTYLLWNLSWSERGDIGILLKFLLQEARRREKIRTTMKKVRPLR